MNAYVSFITEFGIVMLVAFLILLLAHVTCNHAWNKTTICWLILLCYLYIQFEGYAFYALWLYIWATGFPQTGRNPTPEIRQLRTAIEKQSRLRQRKQPNSPIRAPQPCEPAHAETRSRRFCQEASIRTSAPPRMWYWPS